METWTLRTLAPAAVCLALAALLVRPGNPSGANYAADAFTLGAIGSNRMACLPQEESQQQNHVSSVTFDWTNRNGSTSSIGSLPPTQ